MELSPWPLTEEVGPFRLGAGPAWEPRGAGRLRCVAWAALEPPDGLRREPARRETGQGGGAGVGSLKREGTWPS